jgi:hypothetical protein
MDLTDGERAAVESLTGHLIDKIFQHLVMRLRLAAQTNPALVNAGEFFFLHADEDGSRHTLEMQDGMKGTLDVLSRRKVDGQSVGGDEACLTGHT